MGNSNSLNYIPIHIYSRQACFILVLKTSPVDIMSSAHLRRKERKNRPKRMTSNVFAMFDQNQIQEFKEAFNMIDANKDQMIDQSDLAEIYASLGKNPTDRELDEMIKMAPGPINFTMFLTMFGEKLMGTDPEDVIKNAFQCFDDNGDGKINDEYLRELLTTMGDRFTDDQVDQLFHDAPISNNGDFNYVEFTKQLKHGKKDPEDKQ